jgi:D-3-phosphoglycerate dehydrogenase
MPRGTLDVVVVGTTFPNLRLEEEILAPIGARLVNASGFERDDVLVRCRDAAGILTDYFAWNRDAIAELRTCRVICQYGVGLDQIDLEAAAEAGIVVTHTPHYCIEEVAEHTIALLFAAARNIAGYDRSVRRGVWDFNVGSPLHRVAGKTLGLIGFGRVGRCVAERCACLRLRLIATDPYQEAESIRDAGVEPVSLTGLLAQADFVSIHAPLTEATRGIIGRKELSLMKRGVILINTARGALVDQAALAEALAEGHVAGAGLDVLEREPAALGERVLEFEKVVVTPHAAFLSEESLCAVQRDAALEVRRVLVGEPALHAVNRAGAVGIRSQ